MKALSLASLALSLSFLAPAACGGGSTTTGSDGGVGTGTGVGSGVGNGTPVTLPDGTTVPTVACGDEHVATASGTWDIVASGARKQESAVITVEPTSLTIESSGRKLAFGTNGAAMTLQWTDVSANRQSPITVTHAGTTVDTGLLPLALGGQWSFAGQRSESCTASLTATAFDATCTDVHSTPFGSLQGTVVGIRQQKASSIFGELGGSWHLTSTGTATVDVTVSGNVFTAVVNGNAGPAGRSGWVTVKVCNGAAAGKTSSGVELAGSLH